MCGHHHDHDHAADLSGRPKLRIQLGRGQRPRTRRRFLGEMGGAIAAAVVTPLLVSCGTDDGGSVATTDSSVADSAPAATAADAELRWARADLGFVSAFVLARGNRATLVDTGVSGSADAIGETLGALGLNYNDVEHVILTHKHGDHAGSMGEVLGRAVNATAWAGEADLGELPSDDEVRGLVGGEDVFGLEMLATPGHTAGHMAVIDHESGLLVAGDALWTEGGAAVEGPAQYTSDEAAARDTIRSLAELTFNTLLVGHGEPIETGADAAMVALAASL